MADQTPLPVTKNGLNNYLSQMAFDSSVSLEKLFAFSNCDTSLLLLPHILTFEAG
jgi:hypothetical protein